VKTGGVEVPEGATPVPAGAVGLPVGGALGERVMVDNQVDGTQVVTVMTEMLGADEV